MKRLIAMVGVACLLVALLAVSAQATPLEPPALAMLPGLTAEEAQTVEAVAEEELAEMRGRYAGYYFSADMSGYWDNLGRQQAQLNTSTNISMEQVGSLPSLEGPSVDLSNQAFPQVSIHAFVGSIQNTSGLIQITQVPGNNNVITQVMNLKIMVINAPNGAPDLANLLPQIAGF